MVGLQLRTRHCVRRLQTTGPTARYSRYLPFLLASVSDRCIVWSIQPQSCGLCIKAELVCQPMTPQQIAPLEVTQSMLSTFLMLLMCSLLSTLPEMLISGLSSRTLAMTSMGRVLGRVLFLSVRQPFRDAGKRSLTRPRDTPSQRPRLYRKLQERYLHRQSN